MVISSCLRRCADKRGLQVAAMDDPVGRAVTRRGRLPEWHAHDFAAALGVENAQRRGLDHLRPQSLFQPEIDQRARCVRRELNAGAGFLKPLGLFQHDDAKTAARQRQSRGQPADAGACDNDDARRRQDVCSVQGSGDDVTCKAHCAGRAAFGRKRRIVTIKGRAVGAHIVGILAHVAEHVRMIERRRGAHAHEFLGADLDYRNARIVVKMRNDFVRIIAVSLSSHGARTVAPAFRRHHSGRDGAIPRRASADCRLGKPPALVIRCTGAPWRSNAAIYP